MNEEALAADPATEGTTPPTEAAVLSQEVESQEPERDWEAEARADGWVPEEEFKGTRKPSRFLSAQEYVERGETVAPLLKAKIGKLEALLAEKDRAHEERLARIEKATNAGVERMKRQHEKELAEARAERLDAVKRGDTAAFEAADKQVAELEKSAPDAEAQPDKNETPEARKDRIQAEWTAKNQWFIQDFEAGDLAIRYSQHLANANPSISMEDNLAQTEAYMRKKRPDLFGEPAPETKPATNGHAAVDGGGMLNGTAPSASKTPLFDKLPADAKRQAENDIKLGLFTSKEEWARVYNS